MAQRNITMYNAQTSPDQSMDLVRKISTYVAVTALLSDKTNLTRNAHGEIYVGLMYELNKINAYPKYNIIIATVYV